MGASLFVEHIRAIFNKMKMLLPMFCILISLSALPCFAATIESYSGTVELKEGTRLTPVLGKVPLPFSTGQSVVTATGGKAYLKLDDGSEVALASGSEFRLTKDINTSKTSALELAYGKIRVLVRKVLAAESNWTIRSGDTVMGVRGTEFIIDANRDRTLLCSFSGAVEVHSNKAPEQAKIVRANEGVIVADDGKISQPVAMDPRQMNWWRDETATDASPSTDDWHWGAPVAVEELDPNAIYSKDKFFSPHGTFWNRLNHSENVSTFGRGASHSDPNLLSRLALSGVLTPTRYALLYAQVTGTVKSGHANPDSTGIRLHQAFALVRAESTHSIAVGRQEWEFGDGLLIGREPWNLHTRSFDGVLGTLRTAPARVRVFSSMLEDRNKDLNVEDWMVGAYSELSKIPLHLYGLWVRRAGNSASRYGMLGERLELAPWGPLFLNEEFIFERGTTTETFNATLGYADAGVRWQLMGVSGLLKAVYLRASDTFIPLFNDTHRFLGLVNAFSTLKNIQRVGGSVAARYAIAGRPLTAQFDYSSFSSGSSDLGDEFDLQLGFEPHSLIFLQMGAGLLSPGRSYSASAPNAYLAFLSAQIRL